MKEKEILLKPDDRNRITLTKLQRKLYPIYRARIEENGCILLEPIREIPKEQEWIFDPANKEILAKIKRGLKQKGTIDRGSFSKYISDDDE